MNYTRQTPTATIRLWLRSNTVASIRPNG